MHLPITHRSEAAVTLLGIRQLLMSGKLLFLGNGSMSLTVIFPSDTRNPPHCAHRSRPIEATFLSVGLMPTVTKMKITQIGNMNIPSEAPRSGLGCRLRSPLSGPSPGDEENHRPHRTPRTPNSRSLGTLFGGLGAELDDPTLVWRPSAAVSVAAGR